MGKECVFVMDDKEIWFSFQPNEWPGDPFHASQARTQPGCPCALYRWAPGRSSDLVNAEEEVREIQFTMPHALCSTSHVSGHDLSVLPEMSVANREGCEVGR